MIESSKTPPPADSLEPRHEGAAQVADYIADLTRELATMAGDGGMSRLAAALELAHALAKEALAEFGGSQSGPVADDIA